ncbi:MAG TPA: LacI family DNA-binding transcriptional regulator [Nocardioides sp.]|uniref:LacI family DNA-binding transcriptional regulator n=1 Tax=Nocardioides sp. TaxID=35761 RepID=UPI002B6DF904|nr:LacI family DNA-binding transcriptional regulator [Nocardioides sp.]HQR26115.1 LacI family DNA-binding transcriptional regulator [Nocardioides sp.]
MADVAARAGVSTATVSRALRDLPGVSDQTRRRIKTIAEEMAYVVSPEASALAKRVTGRVAVVLPRADIWFYATMLASINRVLTDAGLDVLLYQVDGVEQRTRFFRELPARRKVDALVLVALPVLHHEASRLGLMRVHVVVAGGQIGQHPHVRVDDAAVAATAVGHLTRLGHRRIGMIRTSDTEGTYWSSDAERSRGYREALLAAGLEPDPAYVVTRPFGIEAGASGMAALLDLPEPPTAVFAFSDEIALSATHELHTRGLRVPEDVSVIGVDGHPLAGVFGLDTVDQSVAEQGRLAGEMALALVSGDELSRHHVVVPTRLVLRGSTSAPGAGRRRDPLRAVEH